MNKMHIICNETKVSWWDIDAKAAKDESVPWWRRYGVARCMESEFHSIHGHLIIHLDSLKSVCKRRLSLGVIDGHLL